MASGLSARMDQPGARVDPAAAVGIINAYRSTTGVPPLANDASLDAIAQALASQYASSGTPPSAPPGVVAIKLSAGYATFAETFSGWRNSPQDAQALTVRNATKAGVASAFNGSSSFGVYWVMVVGN